MINLAGVEDADKHILEELYLAGIKASKIEKTKGEVPYSFVGKIGQWTLSRRWYYWSASVENCEEGLPLKQALELHNQKHPIDERILGDIIRAGGHAGGISPDDYVSQPIYSEKLDLKLEALGYKKEPHPFEKGKEYIPINYGEIAELCKLGKLDIQRYVNCYHIDEQIGLNEFANFLKNK